MAEGARQDLAEGLGPEFQDFDIADLHPRNFVRKHLLDDKFDLDDLDPRKMVRKHLMDEPTDEQHGSAPYGEDTAVALLQPGESPPYDSEAT